MFDSFVLYAALLGVAAGVITMFWRRALGAEIAGAALVAIVVVLLWPATTKHSASAATQLDHAMPVYQFDERHDIHVNAPPEKVYAAIRGVTADEIQFFQTLTAIRRGFRPLPPGILNAPKSEPLLSVATRSGFKCLTDDAPHEMVVGLRVTPETFATMNFVVTPDASGSNVSTETRVLAKSKLAERRFAIYWRTIHPGSDIIRRMWLRAIKRRAEA